MFAPDGKVLAFIRGPAGGGDQDLCFLPVAKPAKISCATDSKVSVDRPAWSADGSAVLTVATDPVDQGQSELFLYTTTKPFSADAAAWSPKGLVTDSMHGKRPGELVLFAALAPDGKQLALAANWDAKDLSVFSVFLAPWTPAGPGKPKPVSPTVRACDVAWRPDSKELAVTRADDCRVKSGDLVRVDVKDPSVQVTLRQSAGSDPAWQPVKLATH